MAPRLSSEFKNSIKSLLLRRVPYSSIRKMYPTVSKNTLTRLRKLYLGDGHTTKGGRPSKITSPTKSYIARQLRTGVLDGPRGVRELLSSENVEMSLSGIRKSLRQMGFKAKRKVKTNFISNKNMRRRLAWAKKHKNYTVDQWRQWVFSDETRVNMWGSDGNSFYWSDGEKILRPHQMVPQVQEDGGGVLFWSYITAKGPGYGTTIIDGTVNSEEYVKILGTSLIDTLDHFDMTPNTIRFQQDNATPHTSIIAKQWFSNNGFSLDTLLHWPSQSPDLNPIEHVWYQLKRRLNNYPTRPTTKEELADRIEKEWYKFTQADCLKYIDSMPARIEAVIKAKGGATRY